MLIKDLKIGEYFTLKPIENPTEKQVFIRGEYDRSEKKVAMEVFDDIKGKTVDVVSDATGEILKHKEVSAI